MAIKREFSAAEIAAAYVAVAAAAHTLSGYLFSRMASGTPAPTLWAAAGAVEIVLAAGLVYGLVRSSRRSLQAQRDRLQASEDILDILFRMIRHDLRTELTVIRGYVANAVAEHEDPPPEYERVIRTTDDIIARIEKAATLRRLAQDDVERIEVNLVAVLDRQVDAVRETADGLDVEVEAPEAAPVETVSQIDVALREVLENAVEHHPRTPSIRIVVEPATRPGDLVEVRVTDDGPGIPEYERQVIEAGRESQLLHSSGLGLWLIYWAVTRSGGSLDITDTEPRGSVVTLRLPAAGRPSGQARIRAAVEDFMR